MGKGIWIGDNNTAHSMKAGWIGVDGVARKIKNIWIGDTNNIARLCYSSIPNEWILFDGYAKDTNYKNCTITRTEPYELKSSYDNSYNYLLYDLNNSYDSMTTVLAGVPFSKYNKLYFKGYVSTWVYFYYSYNDYLIRGENADDHYIGSVYLDSEKGVTFDISGITDDNYRLKFWVYGSGGYSGTACVETLKLIN